MYCIIFRENNISQIFNPQISLHLFWRKSCLNITCGEGRESSGSKPVRPQCCHGRPVAGCELTDNTQAVACRPANSPRRGAFPVQPLRLVTAWAAGWRVSCARAIRRLSLTSGQVPSAGTELVSVSISREPRTRKTFRLTHTSCEKCDSRGWESSLPGWSCQ